VREQAELIHPESGEYFLRYFRAHEVLRIKVKAHALAVVVVNAKDERARGFYLHHDFIPLPMQPNRHFYLMRTIEKLFSR
jgi:hypothetical protein